MACSSCKFFSPDASECHRFPPQVSVVMLPTPQNRMALTTTPAFSPSPVACFPPTDPTNLCGEYSPNLQ
jgi:hypothetical protein